MRNLLLKLEEHQIPHFIVKSKVTVAFEVNDHRWEYHVYHHLHPEIGKWDLKCDIYEGLKWKIFSQDEIKWFRENIDRYKEENRGNGGSLRSGDGRIWVNKLVGFDPYSVKRKIIQHDKVHADPGVLQHG